MSASELLGRLDGELGDLLPILNYYIGPGARTAVSRESVDLYYATKALRNALPELVAVVKAAEALPSLRYSNDQPSLAVAMSAKNLRATLTALAAKLEADTPS